MRGLPGVGPDRLLRRQSDSAFAGSLRGTLRSARPAPPIRAYSFEPEVVPCTPVDTLVWLNLYATLGTGGPGYTAHAWDGTHLWQLGYATSVLTLWRTNPDTGTSDLSYPLGLGGGTKGITYGDGHLWVLWNSGIGGTDDVILKIDPASGSTVATITAGAGYPNTLSGIAWDDGVLWSTHYSAGPGHSLRRLSTAGAELATAPTTIDTYASELAWDGTYLWATRGGSSSTIYKLNPDGTIVDTLNGPHLSLTGVDFIDRTLYAASAQSRRVYMTDVCQEDV